MANTIGWGQGTINNTNGWGKGASNNSINRVEKTEKSIEQIENGAFQLNEIFRDRVEDDKDLIVNNFYIKFIIM